MKKNYIIIDENDTFLRSFHGTEQELQQELNNIIKDYVNVRDLEESGEDTFELHYYEYVNKGLKSYSIDNINLINN